mgnify:CR=1 FL=1
MSNPYKVLNIPANASINVARQKYLKMAKKYHPDTTEYNNEIALSKIQEINEAYSKIKETISYSIVLIRPKGRFTKNEIEEIIRRFNSGQSLYKIGRDMKRRQKSIVKHLVRLGLMEEPVYEEEKKWLFDKVFIESWFFDFSVLTLLFIFWPFWHVASIIFLYFVWMKSYLRL